MFLRTLENCIKLGVAIMFTSVEESIDPVLNNILSRDIRSMYVIIANLAIFIAISHYYSLTFRGPRQGSSDTGRSRGRVRPGLPSLYDHKATQSALFAEPLQPRLHHQLHCHTHWP